ncbi:CPBP family intramembrane glutamic endopeptidase [Nocardia fusca]|uniref:CPBP family intramembrane glutamic endopeptidase n=1 Tax=Nocardia fusca TaxID=941183 RepID=A0ABV3FFG5_9NOCA
MSPAARPGPSAVDTSRPFGAHLRMRWWKPLVLMLVTPVVLLVLQVLAFRLVGVVEGSDDPLSPELTPLKSLAVNLATAVTGLVAVLLLVWMTQVPWRALFSWRRAFDRRRLAHYSIGAALLVGAGAAVVGVVAPQSTGWTTFAVSGTTIAFLAVTVLTTPLQSAGEELVYRSVLLPAAASWVRPVRPALAVGLVVSALSFAVVHGSTDPWLGGYFVVVAVSTGLTAIISGGMEAPIAFHVVNNVLFGVIGNVLSGGGTTTIDRATDTGDASLLTLFAVNVGMVALVATYERCCRRHSSEVPTHRPEGTL